MAKTCQVDNCNNPVWGKGYCKGHQYLRQDKVSTGIKKSVQGLKRKPTGEKKIFDEIITERPCKSEVSGFPIYNPGPANCAHVLPKKKYPHFRLKKEAIMLLTIDEHFLVDNGTQAQREAYAIRFPSCNWDKFYNKAEQLKSEYKKLFDN